MSLGEEGGGFSSALLLIVAMSNADNTEPSDKRNRFMDWTPVTERLDYCSPALLNYFLLISMVILVSSPALTATVFVIFPKVSCQTSMVWLPGATSLILNAPLLSVASM